MLFLRRPASAAGIFNSNLNAGDATIKAGTPDQSAFEAALGSPVLDADALYAARERASLELVRAAFPLVKFGV